MRKYGNPFLKIRRLLLHPLLYLFHEPLVPPQTLPWFFAVVFVAMFFRNRNGVRVALVRFGRSNIIGLPLLHFPRRQRSEVCKSMDVKRRVLECSATGTSASDVEWE